MEEMHTSIKMSAGEFLRIHSSSNILWFSLCVQNDMKGITAVIAQNTVFNSLKETNHKSIHAWNVVMQLNKYS